MRLTRNRAARPRRFGPSFIFRLLRKPYPTLSVHFLQLVLSSEVEYHPPRVTLHGLRSRLLEVNLACQGCAA